MSPAPATGVAVVLSRDGRVVSPELPRELLHAYQRGGADDSQAIISQAYDDHAVLALIGRERGARCGIGMGESGVSVAFHGRLYGRNALCRELGIAIDHPASDAELVLRAYARWALDAPARLNGDFAFALWDSARRRLFCARDIAGLKGFYYYATASFLIAASHPGLALSHPGAHIAPNSGFVAETLSLRPASTDQTLFDGLSCLPAAHWLVCDHSGLRTHRYWTPMPDHRHSARRSAAQWQEAFEESVHAAVRDRVGTCRDTAVTLSGGLDSTMLAAAAAEVMGCRHPRQVNTYALRYPTLACDEGRFIRRAVACLDARQHTQVIEQAPATDPVRECRRRWDLAPYPTVAAMTDLFCTAAGDGCRTMLLGEGGDDWFMAGSRGFGGALREGRWGDLVRLVARQAAGAGIGATARDLAIGVSWSAAPAGLRAWLNSHRRAAAPNPLLDAGFAARHQLEERLRAADRIGVGLPLDQSERFRMATSALAQSVHVELDRLHWRSGVAALAPLLDRRLIELALAVPADRLTSAAGDRALHRATEGRWLPRAIARRRDKTDFHPLFVAALTAPMVLRRLDALAATGRDWLDRDALGVALRRLRAAAGGAAPITGPLVLQLWTVYALDGWYRAFCD